MLLRYYEKVIVPVPAVNFVTLNEPSVVVVAVKPLPTEIELVSGYLRITTPELPLAPLDCLEPPPPEPVLAVDAALPGCPPEPPKPLEPPEPLPHCPWPPPPAP